LREFFLWTREGIGQIRSSLFSLELQWTVCPHNSVIKSFNDLEAYLYQLDISSIGKDLWGDARAPWEELE